MSFNPTGGAQGSRLTVPAPAYPRASGFEDLEGLMFTEADGERELLEGLEGTSVQEKLVDSDFFNRFDDDFDETDMALH